MIKVVGAEHGAAQCIDRAIQAHGGGGVSRGLPARRMPTPRARTLRLADGPDEVHRETRSRRSSSAKHAGVREGRNAPIR